jgi:hypothetical protein
MKQKELREKTFREVFPKEYKMPKAKKCTLDIDGWHYIFALTREIDLTTRSDHIKELTRKIRLGLWATH